MVCFAVLLVQLYELSANSLGYDGSLINAAHSMPAWQKSMLVLPHISREVEAHSWFSLRLSKEPLEH